MTRQNLFHRSDLTLPMRGLLADMGLGMRLTGRVGDRPKLRSGAIVTPRSQSTVDALVDRGLIARVHLPGAELTQHYELTDRGQAIADKINGIHSQRGRP